MWIVVATFSLTRILFSFNPGPCCVCQVWFQNRRMKDKRQRMAMAWPYGIADPHIYAYIAAAAAANYPYSVSGPATPSALGYYPGVGLGLGGGPGVGIPHGAPMPFSPQAMRPTTASDFLAAAAASSAGGGGCIRPGGGLPAPHPLAMSPLSALGCGMRAGPVDPVSLLSHHHHHPHHQASPPSPQSIMAAALNSQRVSGRASFSPPSAHVQSRPSVPVPVSKTSGGSGSNSTAPNGLFRPFQSDVEKS